jgi:hypothetical protein
MRVAPKKWTYHHTQRLYHISMLACFVFINFVIIFGIFAVLFEANAGQYSLTPESVGVSATVPGIASGPIEVAQSSNSSGGGGGYSSPLPAGVTPQVTVRASDKAPLQPVKTAGGKTVNIPAYSTQNPDFNGTTNIKDAIIFLDLNFSPQIHAATYADLDGNWSWFSGEAIRPGIYRLKVTAQDPEDLTLSANTGLDFEILPQAQPEFTPPYSSNLISPAPSKGGNLFDVLVKVPAQFQTIAPGDDLVANIKLINFGSAGNPVDVTVQYVIEDDHNQVIMESSQTVAVATQLSFLKTFNTNPSFPQGNYKLIVRVPSKDVIATSADSFTVKGEAVIPLGPGTKVNFTVFFQALLIMLFLFSLISYFEFNKVSVLSRFIKKVDEEDLYEYNK